MNGSVIEVKNEEIWQFNDIKIDWTKLDAKKFRYNMKEYI
jgi:hypothetical protein